ncbi:MAG TPA: S9 family peptidase [Terracidiphilus sp.]|jgi:dipeptidyl aminopeptidase/acylaminoacyl peptidase
MRRLILLVVCFLVATFGFAQSPLPPAPSAKRPMTFEDMMHMKRLGDTVVSPDGKWLAYAVTTVDLAANTKTQELWLQAIAGGEPIKVAVAQPGDSGIQFAPDGRSVLFISSRENGEQVWIADFDGVTGATSSAKKLTAISTGADNAKWSPDGHSVIFTSDVYPACPAITTADFSTGDKCNAGRDAVLAASKVKAQIWTALLYRHWDHYTGEKRFHLFQVLVESGGMRDLTPNDPRDVPPFSLEESSCGCAFSPDSKELAFTENPDPVPAISISASIFTIDLTEPLSKAKKISTSAGGNFDPAYSPDGRYLAWRSEARAGYESDKFRLWLYDRAAKTGRDLLPKFDNWVDEFAWAASSSRIYFASADFGEGPIFRVDLPQAPPIQLTAAGEFSSIHALSDGSIVAARMMVDDPGEVFRLHPDQVAPLRMVQVQLCQDCVPIPTNMTSQRANHLGELAWDSVSSRITHLNDALLAQLDQEPMEPFWFTAQDGTKLEGFLIPPPGFDATKKYPVKFLIHGGPQGNWGDDWSYRWNAELFAANGYVVVMINPRGSTGYGQAIVEEVSGDWGGKPFTDLMTGLDYAEEHYPFIDKDRECALGASYGGYMANWILGHTNRFKCIVTHDGMFNAESAFGSTEEDWFNIWEFKGHPWDYYGKPDDQNPFRKWSPSLYAKNFKTPTLVVHGQLDYRLDVSEGFQLFDTLQLLGVPSKMLYFPDEGHWVLKPQNSQLWYKTVNDWVDQWVKNSH